jgi:hypothetical protein
MAQELSADHTTPGVSGVPAIRSAISGNVTATALPMAAGGQINRAFLPAERARPDIGPLRQTFTHHPSIRACRTADYGQPG